MSLASDLSAIPQFKRGQVWCRICNATQRVDAVQSTMGGGWPKCCGQTMTIDSPEEQARLSVKTPEKE